MKIYRESLKNIITAAIVLALLTAFAWYFRANISEVAMVTWKLTVGETRSVCTPEERFQYLKKHPEVINLAIIGNWEGTALAGRPRQNILAAAIYKINQKGGIRGRKIIPDWMDTKGSADILHEYVEKVAHDPSYFCIIGPSTSGQLLSVKPLLLSYRILTIAPSITNTGVTSPDDPPYIFIPNASDEQDVKVLRQWALDGNRSGFILINENQPFSAGYAKHVERLFFENEIMISSRTFFNPTDNISYFLAELQNYAGYFNIQHALIVNYSAQRGSYEQLAKWMLTNTKGDIFTYKLLQGDYSDEELKRMYSIVYSKRSEMMRFYVNELSHLPNALTDAFTPATYRAVFLLADACRQAETMHPDEVIKVMQNNDLKGPAGYFRFNEDRFEKNPVTRVISTYELQKDWGIIMMKGKPVHRNKPENQTPAVGTVKP